MAGVIGSWRAEGFEFGFCLMSAEGEWSGARVAGLVHACQVETRGYANTLLRSFLIKLAQHAKAFVDGMMLSMQQHL